MSHINKNDDSSQAFNGHQGLQLKKVKNKRMSEQEANDSKSKEE